VSATDELDAPDAPDAPTEPGDAPPAWPDEAPPPPPPPRTGIRRLTGAPAETWFGLAVVVGCMVFVFLQLQPHLLFTKNTPAGGDMGAHVWGPAYLRDHLLPHLRLTGWTPDWYAGFPAFQFYMVPPALLIVLLNVVLPYGIAFKLVTVLGVLSLPAAAYVMGRLFRMAFPGPPLLAAATVPYLFDRTWTIYGGNIASTLAGEYSFSISLSLSLLFFGVMARALEDGKHRGLAAVLLCGVILCHSIPGFFALLGGIVLVLLRPSWRRIRFAAPVLALGCMLAGFWAIPFVLRRGYLTDMGWEKLVTYKDALFPDATRWVLILALIGIVLSLAFLIRIGAFLGVLAVVAGLGVRLDALEVVHIWNARLLPFWYLTLYLLAAVGVSEVFRSIAVLVDGHVDWRRRVAEMAGAAAALLAVLIVVALPLRVLPGGRAASDGTYRWLGLHTKDDSFVDSWAQWNYSGYEGKPSYPEYRAVMATMARVGKTDGCGRAMWEYSSDLNRYGTPMAMMLLPFWTDGCIGSMEGLYFESSATTPFHFLNAAEVSKAPSNPVRSMPERPVPYSSFNLENGIRHLQLMGVRYYMAFSDVAVAAADASPELRLVAQSAPWKVYEIRDAEPVAALKYQPAVLKGMSNANPAWDRDAIAWYTDPTALDVPLAPSGPAAWQRVRRGQAPKRVALPKVAVRHIHEGDLTVSFDVDRTGVPVLVKTSYFPNWTVKGAKGVYRATPNLMVVVPTAKHVELTYRDTPVDYLGWTVSGVGVLGVVALVRIGQVDLPSRRRREDVEAERTGAEGDGGWTPPERAEPEPAPEPIGFWDSLLAERKAQAAKAPQRPQDAAGDGGAGRSELLHADRDLGDEEPGPLDA
jgi:hypothetical protein